MGLSGSTLTWAFVELVDFFIETYRQFIMERSQFLIMVERHWGQLKSIFRTQTPIENIPWEDVNKIIEDLYSQAAAFPFQGGVYSISKEFETASMYITRLYWKMDGYVSGDVIKKREQGYWNPLYRVFVSIQSETIKNPARTLSDFYGFDIQIDALREIDVSFDDYSHPANLIDCNEYGDLGESFSIPSGEIKYTTFKPAYDFHQKFHEDPPRGVFLTVMGLIFRKIKEWNNEK